jgi:hypothetical protein
MSRLKSMKGLWAFVGGVAATIILVPSMAVAAPTVLSYVGIKDASGNKAVIEPDGQMYTTNAPPKDLFANPLHTISIAETVDLVPTPPGLAAIVTSIGADLAPQSQVLVFIGANGCPNTTDIADLRILVTDSGDSLTVTFPTGVAIPNGDALCATGESSATAGSLSAQGYAVPSSSVAAIRVAPHPVPSLKR